MTKPAPGNLDELLAKMPRDVTLPRNLWPEIARGLERRPRFAGYVAAAASLAIASVAGALVWAVMHAQPAGRDASPAAVSTMAGFDEPRNPAYRAARAELEKSFAERLATLSPETRATIEANLALIRRAHEQIRQALAAAPANPVLEELLESTWHDEFDLYDSVVRATQPALLRI